MSKSKKAKKAKPAAKAKKKVVAKKVVAKKKEEVKKPIAVKPEVKAPVKTAPVAEKAVKTVAAKAKITFTLPKEAVENAETVAVLGDFNNWQKGYELKKQKDGSFKGAIELEKGRSYEFRFLIDGSKWENAWDAKEYKATPFGGFNSVVTV